MPVIADPAAGSRLERVGDPPILPSAAMELYSLTFALQNGYERHGLSAPGRPSRRSRALAQRVLDFWPDATVGLGEILVVADRLGVLLGTDPAPLLAMAPAEVFATKGVALASEAPQDREALLARLDRLRHDSGLRRRWVALLNDLWREILPGWESEGLHRVEAVTERLRARQSIASGTIEVLRGHLNCNKFDQELQSAEELGRLALAPSSVSTGWVLLFDLPSTWVLGFSVDPQRGAQDLRHHAEKLAARVKALSDPTRLAMLSHLAAQPATITELADAFELAQPTVSTHFRILRDAALVNGVRQHGRTLYAVDGDRVRGLLAELNTALLPSLSPAKSAAKSGEYPA
jgi:DNA-binding transcriptional ArsR family regulator